MMAAIRKAMKRDPFTFTLQSRHSNALASLKGTASAVPQRAVPTPGALAPVVNLLEARSGW